MASANGMAVLRMGMPLQAPAALDVAVMVPHPSGGHDDQSGDERYLSEVAAEPAPELVTTTDERMPKPIRAEKCGDHLIWSMTQKSLAS